MRDEPSPADRHRWAVMAETAALVVESGGSARVVVGGYSMRPFLKRGMVLQVEALRGSPRRGDVLVYRSDGDLVAHRLVGFEGESLLLCGDAEPRTLERVAPRDVVGRAVAGWTGPQPEARGVRTPFRRSVGLAFVVARPFRVAARRCLNCIRHLLLR